MELSEKILRLRKREGMSQEDLAEKLNVSRQALSRWENGSAQPDANNLLQISKLFRVTTDYLLNDSYNSDDDLPAIVKVKEDNKILKTNLTLIAIILQAAALNIAAQPILNGVNSVYIFAIKFILLLAASIWMAHNLKYEKDPEQYRKNVKIELLYCIIQATVALFAYFSRLYFVGAVLLIVVCLIYILVINPKYMNRQLARKRK